MSGSENTRPGFCLSPDMLSTRSYLELDEPQRQHRPELETPDSLPSLPSIENEKIEIQSSSEGKSGPRLAKPDNSEKTVTVGQSRKRGRPRLETAKDAAAIEERRLQIRRAQRTYRQKKEATIQALKTRVEVLEQTLSNITDLIGSESESSRIGNSLAVGNLSKIARTRELILTEIEKVRSPTEDNNNNNNNNEIPTGDGVNPEIIRASFGYDVSHSNMRFLNDWEDIQSKNRSQEHTYIRARSPSPLINRLFPTTTIYTYSHQESDLARRLQRFCLEHTYRWLSDPCSSPDLMSRVFGLIPCIHDMPGIRRNYRRILQAEIGDPLEVNKLPYYKLGGAGTHYPRIGIDGQPIYPEKLRRPGKILRRMTRILQRGGIQDWDEDWSGNVEPLISESGEYGDLAMSDADRLRALDLDGEWFDCHDVQGYLVDRGLASDDSSMWMKVPSSTVAMLYGVSRDHSALQSYNSPSEASSDMSGATYLGSVPYVLDVEAFFDLLLSNLRILGRAPGFRLGDVDAALRKAIHRRPLS